MTPRQPCHAPAATVGAIAREVGYANAFALSVAFKRLRGITVSPRKVPLRPS
ncbi:hypothetical protein ABZ297_31120 [Nonomuraea sp. NPDC005983]|uniref:hypothetical protein n=1 Tax=Nonomuraea sp. NPDC005983 TaxID=3155595 RepID=UPI0033B3FC15